MKGLLDLVKPEPVVMNESTVGQREINTPGSMRAQAVSAFPVNQAGVVELSPPMPSNMDTNLTPVMSMNNVELPGRLGDRIRGQKAKQRFAEKTGQQNYFGLGQKSDRLQRRVDRLERRQSRKVNRKLKRLNKNK